ncbi:GNAT family N-acetyltransferase [Pseudonocardia adelaidensis]|uniref:N-acetyltransferase domain-containing protein n=1 Tax=Pseudonocardia adelaidensis TaxID=648754 RepID=A0ABP9P3P8_9PSEU
MRIRPARVGETALLNDLVMRSKAYWGYDEEFLAACRDELTIDAGDVTAGRVVVAEDGHGVRGVASLQGCAPEGELGLLFVDPEAIGTGVGRALYRHVLAMARELGFTRLRIEADPNAAPFYRATGARPAGTAPSGSVPGRALPVLEVALPVARGGWLDAWTGGRRAAHLGNVAEFQAQWGDPSEEARRAGSHYACLAAFASPDPAVLVLPRPVPRAWVELNAAQLAWDRVVVYDGLDDRAGLVAAVLARPALATHLRDSGLALLPWGRTRAFGRLTGEDLPSAALRYESKRAAHEVFVRLAPAHPRIAVPAQWPVPNRWAAARSVRARARRGHATIVKTEHGAGGSGTWLVDGHRVRLPRGPLLLEEVVLAGTPRDVTYDGVIGPGGEVHDVGVAVMDVKGTAYRGATVGPGVVPDPLAETASRFGHAVGGEIGATGYRGWFDVDFVTGGDGRLAPTEINLRLTGPSAAFMIKARLDRIRGGDHVVRTVDQVPLGARLPDDELIALLRRLCRRCAENGTVLVPTIPTAAYEPAPYLGVALAAHAIDGLDAAEALVRDAALDVGRMFSPPDGSAAPRRSSR